MPSNIILECAQRKGTKHPDSNSEWVSTFQNPVPIETGDVIQLKQALILRILWTPMAMVSLIS